MNTIEPRFVRRNATPSADANCQLCGTFWGGFPTSVCPATTCMACGTPQCMVNGLGRGQCAMCLVGLLPGWSGTDRKCGYKGCSYKAVAAVPRVDYCCRTHLHRAKKTVAGKACTVATTIQWALAHRNIEWVLVPSVEDVSASVG